MPILQIKDKDGIFIPIPAIRGKDGKSAYEQAVEGGYIGTEEAFIALLNGLTATEDADHYADFNNPHRVTKEQVGLGNVDNTSDIDKPVSTAQQAAISNVQTNLNAHAADADKHVGKGSGVGVFIGGGSSSTYGSAVGYLTSSTYGGAMGYQAETTSGCAAGYLAESTAGGAVGANARTSSGFAGGFEAITENEDGKAIDAIQLGTGVNKHERTLQVYDYTLMDANGKIVPDRLPIKTGYYTGTGTDGYDGELTLTFDFTPKLVIVAPTSNIQVTDKVCYECQPMIMIYGVSDCTGGAQRKANITSNGTNYTDYVCNAGGIVTWSDNSVSWKAEAEWADKELPAIQVYNYAGVVYRYVAIG